MPRKNPYVGMPLSIAPQADRDFDILGTAYVIVKAVREAIYTRFGFRLSPRTWRPRVHYQGNNIFDVTFLRAGSWGVTPCVIAGDLLWDSETQSIAGCSITLI